MARFSSTWWMPPSRTPSPSCVYKSTAQIRPGDFSSPFPGRRLPLPQYGRRRTGAGAQERTGAWRNDFNPSKSRGQYENTPSPGHRPMIHTRDQPSPYFANKMELAPRQLACMYVADIQLERLPKRADCFNGICLLRRTVS